jgi:hypothetical protein
MHSRFLLTPDVFRHRHRFAGLIPTVERALWSRVTWLWWTWDFLPPRVGASVQGILNDLFYTGSAAGHSAAPEAGAVPGASAPAQVAPSWTFPPDNLARRLRVAGHFFGRVRP